MAMRYEIKTSGINTPNVTKKTISFFSGSKEARKFKSDISFDNKVNGGQGALSISLNENFNSQDILMGDLIRVRNFTDDNKLGTQIYFGYIETLTRVIEERGQSIELSCQGIAYLFRDILSGLIVTDDPSNIITSLINTFNSKYTVPLITVGIFPLAGYNIDFQVGSVPTPTLDAIQKVISITDWVWFVDGNGVFQMKPKTATVDNILIFQKEITKISLGEEREDITNRLTTKSPSPQITALYEDLVSQAQYGNRELYMEVDYATSDFTQDTQGNTFILANAYPKQRLKLELNIKSDFNVVIPGNLIRVKNINATISDARVVRTVYGSDKFIVECDKTETIGQAIVNGT